MDVLLDKKRISSNSSASEDSNDPSPRKKVKHKIALNRDSQKSERRHKLFLNATFEQTPRKHFSRNHHHNDTDSKNHRIDRNVDYYNKKENRISSYDKSQRDISRSTNHRGYRNQPLNLEKSVRKSGKFKNKSNSSEDEKVEKNQGNSCYGLVTADGKKLDVKAVNYKYKNNTHSKSKTDVKKQFISRNRSKLTQKEINAKRKEMQENAQWRDEHRVKNIKKYQEEYKLEQEKNSSAFDRDFLKKQLAKAAETGTLESRIKSKINNIQRSGRLMDSNFARR